MREAPTPQEPGLGAGLQPLSVRRNFAWTLGGNIVYAACQWGILIVLARLGSPSIVGHFALALALTEPVFMLSKLQLRSVLASDPGQRHKVGNFLGLRIATSVAGILLVTAIAFAGRYDAPAARVIVLVALSRGIATVSDILWAALQRQERMDRIGISLCLNGVLSLSAVAVAFSITESETIAAATLPIVGIITLLGYDLPNVRSTQEIGVVFRWGQMGPLIRLTLPLGMAMMLTSLCINIPRYFIERDLGASELGYYAALAYLPIAGALVVNSLGEAALPRLGRAFAESGHHAFRSLAVRLVGVGVAVGLAGTALVVVAGRPLVSLLYGADYARFYDLLLLLVIAGGFSFVGSILGYAMTAAERFKVQPVLFALVALIEIAACWALVGERGLIGAGLAYLAGMVVYAAGGAIVVGKVRPGPVA